MCKGGDRSGWHWKSDVALVNIVKSEIVIEKKNTFSKKSVTGTETAFHGLGVQMPFKYNEWMNEWMCSNSKRGVITKKLGLQRRKQAKS